MLASLTHARLRASQGDLPGARRVLREILAADPAHEGALRMLRELAGEGTAPPPEPDEEAAAPPQAGDPAALAAAFRAALEPAAGRRAAAERLRRWLARIGGTRL